MPTAKRHRQKVRSSEEPGRLDPPFKRRGHSVPLEGLLLLGRTQPQFHRQVPHQSRGVQNHEGQTERPRKEESH